MPTPSRDIVIRLIGDGTSLSSTLSKSVGDLTATERKLQDVGRRMASIGDTMTATLTGPLVLAAGGAIKASSDLAEAVNVTARIFGDASDDISRAAEQSAESVGLSERAYREAAASVGGLLANLGFAQEETVAWSQELVTLGADLGSAFNEDPAQAVEAIGSALRGETEPIRRFNVMLSDADVRLRAVELGLANSTAEVDANAKAQATLNLITEQTAAVQGDFAATADGMANSQRILKANVEDLAAELGESLLPFAEDVLAMLIGVVEAFADLPEGTQKAILAFGGIVAAAGPLLSVGGRLVRNFSNISDAASNAASKMSAVGAARFTVATAAVGFLVNRLLDARAAAAAFVDEIESEAGNDPAEVLGALNAELERQITLSERGARLGDYNSPLAVFLDADAKTAADNARALEQAVSALRNETELAAYEGRRFADHQEALNFYLSEGYGYADALAFASMEMAQATDTAATATDGWAQRLIAGQDAAEAFESHLSGVATGLAGLAGEMIAAETASHDFETSFSGFASSMGTYEGLLAEQNDAHREWAQAQADATEDAADSWETYYDEQTVSSDTYLQALSDDLAAQEEHLSLVTEAQRRGLDNIAAEIVAAGPEHNELWTDILRNEPEQVALEAEQVLEAQARTALDTVAATIGADQSIINAHGLVSDAAVAAFAEEFDTTEVEAREALDGTAAAIQGRQEHIGDVMRAVGAHGAAALVEELEAADPIIAGVVSGFAATIATNMNPLMEALGKPAISVAGGSAGVAVGNLVNRNTGGLIPGSGPNVDSVPAMLTTGEYVIQRPAVQRQPQAAWDALNDGRATIVPHDTRNVPPVDTYNAGGLVGYPALVDYMRRSGVPHSVTSTLRPGDPGAHGRGLAADFSIAGHGNRGYGSPGLARIFNTLAPLGAGKIRQLILAAAPQILRNFPSTWGRPGSRGNHWNHVHGAMQPGVSLTGVPAIGGAAGPYGLGVSLPDLPDHQFSGAIGSGLDAALSTMLDTSQEFVDANSFSALMSGSGGLSGNRAANRDLARRLLAAYGWGDHWTAFDRLAMGESGYNNLAQNPTSTAFGIGQFLNSTWATVGGRKTSDPAEQLRLMFRYIEQRYGNPTRAYAAWDRRSPHWYNEGGMVGSPDNPHIRDAGGPLMPGFTFNGTGQAETVVGPSGVVDVNVVRVTAPDVSPPDGPDVVGPDDFLPRPAPPGGALSPELYDQILRNREQARIDALTNTEHLLEVQQHIVDLEAEGLKYTDEWVAALEQAKQIEADISAEARRRGEAIHDAAVQQRRLAEQAQAEADRLRDTLGTQLDQLLDRKATLDRQTADATGRYADAVADAQLRASQDIDRLIASRNDTLFGSFGPLDQQFTAQWGATAGALTRNIQDQVDLFDEWADGIDELRSRGVSEDLIASLGLDDPASLGQVRLLLAANRTELEQLDQALSARRSQTAEQVADESSMLLGALGTAISDVRTSLAVTLNELEEGLADQLSVIGDQMAALGMDAGRSYADRMTEALESGLPGIIGLAEQYRQAFDDAQSAAEAAAQLVVPPPASSPGISTIDRAMLIGAAPNTWSASRTVVLRVGEREFTAYVEDTARGAARTDSFRGALQGTSS